MNIFRNSRALLYKVQLYKTVTCNNHLYQNSTNVRCICLSRGLLSSEEKADKTDRSQQVPTAPHFRTSETRKSKQEGNFDRQDASNGSYSKYSPYTLPHPIWSEQEMNNIEITHEPPKGLADWVAYFGVKTLRLGFDVFSGFVIGERNEKKWLNRVIFLETVAGVPGMVAAMTRHLHSLRRLKRDHGWIHTLLEEAENERMHLISALMIKKPSWFFRACVLISQGLFVNIFFIGYLVSPRMCHKFVGYLEEEAVKTYTKLLQDIDSGVLPQWKTMPAPDVAIGYWKLSPEATMRDMFRAIRADEAHHREVNHKLSSLNPNEDNPFPPGE
ncbi:uncharacterized protein [Apostichopus japonicus]|uniref:uncharacterized protein n=1 Tax=Stichopus japonicus TaxID=307972 RepID=UPI003AB6FCE2